LLTDYSFQQLALRLAAYIVIAAVHGFAVAATAYALGDAGPRHDGRLRIDPLAHLDVIGTASGVLFSIGWIRPIAIDPAALRFGRGSLVLVVAGGAAATLASALILRLLRPFVLPLLSDTLATTGFAFVETISSLSLWFALVNLLPVPPLTGAHLLVAAMPSWRNTMEQRQLYAAAALVILAALGIVARLIAPFYRALAPDLIGG
jgi:Zn-dependent protease